MTQPNTVTIGPHSVRLAPPASYTMCVEIQTVAAVSTVRGLAAALGACWRGPGRPKVAAGQDLADFGARFLDACIAAGLPPAELQRAAGIALREIRLRIERDGGFWEAVEEELGNFEPGAETGGP